MSMIPSRAGVGPGRVCLCLVALSDGKWSWDLDHATLELSLQTKTCDLGMVRPVVPFCPDGVGPVSEERQGGTLKKLFCAFIMDWTGTVSYLTSLTIIPCTCLICALSTRSLSQPSPIPQWRLVRLMRASMLSYPSPSLHPHWEACWLHE
jgi:hypothetical protein